MNNFRFNESPVGMLKRVVEVGRTEETLAREFGDYFTRTRMPALRVGRLQHEHGQPSLVALLDAEADLHLHLEVGDLAVVELTADRHHLEPVQVAHGLRQPWRCRFGSPAAGCPGWCRRSR